MSFSKNRQFNTALVVLLAIVLLLGCLFRFANLDYKVFWVDEVSTAVRASGYTVPEVNRELAQRGIIDRDVLNFYQTVSNGRTFLDSWSAFTKSPEHAPLYFVLTRIWMQLWGSSITTLRSLPAYISLLIFPSLYWLCWELFGQQLVSSIAVILMSVSPFFVAYAQEARPYSLWTVAILLMSASLLRAIRLNNKLAWLLYSLSVIFGFYTSLFSLYVAFFQSVYIITISSKKKFSIIKNYTISSAIALLAFSPWLLIIINSLDLLQENTSWMRGNFNLADIIAVYVGTNLLVFGDLPISQDSNPIQVAIALIVIIALTVATILLFPRWKRKPVKFAWLLSIASGVFLLSSYIYLDLTTIIGALVALGILSLSAYSLYYLIANSNRGRWLFVIYLMLSLPVPLLISDIINQGQSSTAPRYLIPSQLGVLIAVSFTLANKLNASKLTLRKQRLWQFIFAAFITLGVFSCVRNLNTSPFYQKGRNINNIAIAKIINQNIPTLVTVESKDTMDLLSLAYSLSPDVKYKVVTSKSEITEDRDRFDSIYVLKPSEKLKQKLKIDKQIELQQVYKSHIFSADEFPLDLWRVRPLKTTILPKNKYENSHNLF